MMTECKKIQRRYPTSMILRFGNNYRPILVTKPWIVFWYCLQVDVYLHTEEEKQLKKIVWEEMNKEYLEV